MQENKTEEKKTAVDPEKEFQWLNGAKKIVSMSIIPLSGVLFHPIYTIVNAGTCGRIGDSELAAFGLGSLTLGIMAISLGTGFAMTVATKVGQAFGAKDTRLCRVYLNRQFYLNTLLYPFIVLPLIFIRQIYDLIGQDKKVADLAAQYVWIVLPGIYFHFQAMTCIQFASSQRVTQISLYTLSSATVVHIGLVTLFTLVFGWGFIGVCVATSLHFVCRFFVAYYFVQTNQQLKNSHNIPVVLFSKETTQSLWDQTRMGIMGMLMGVWGWWAFDIFTLMASYLSVDEISSQTIMRSLGLLTFMVPVGFSIACGILIGIKIGEGSERAIKFYYKVAMELSLLVSLLQVVVLFTLKDIIIVLFTNIPQIQSLMSSAWIIFLIFVVTDTTQGIASSVLRASGKQQYGALLTFIAYFVLGIPLSIYLVFWNEMSIFGLWCGPTLACGFNTVVYIIIFSKIDWKILIEKGQKQREKDNALKSKKKEAAEELLGQADDEKKV